MIKRVFAGLIALMLMTATVPAAQWNIDRTHSTIGFEVSHMVISTTTGKFKDFSGTAQFDPENLAEGSVEFTVQVASVDTENEKRDGHLRSPDFFEAEKFPTMTFKSKKVISGAENKFKLVGDLTIKDVTKEVTLDCKFKGTVKFMKTTKAGFSASTTINRQDFGLSYNQVLDAGGLAVGNDVDIVLELEFNQAMDESGDGM